MASEAIEKRTIVQESCGNKYQILDAVASVTMFYYNKYIP
jgi:hypothetical protein